MRNLMIFSWTLCFMLFLGTAWGQVTNIFPPDGNVGIGTTTPSAWFSTGPLLEVTNSDRPVLKLNSSAVENTILFANEAIDATTHEGEFHINHSFDAVTPSKSSLDFFSYPGGKVMSVLADGNVGIGTDDPSEKLHVEGNLLLNAYSGSEQGIFFRPGFTSVNKYNLSILTYDSGSGSPDKLSINAYDGIYFNTGSNSKNTRMVVHHNGNVGIGTTNPTNKLEVCGTIRSKELIVEDNWCDYVFFADYQLPTLAEEAQHIQEKGHLSGFESAEEMDGEIKIGDVTKRQQEKIEQMMLHIIEMKQEIESLQAQLDK